MTAHLVLLPSPLLGPAVWRPVRDRLADRGWQAVVAGPTGPVRSPQDVADALLAAVPSSEDVVLVAHSNAGAYVPLLASQRPVVAGVLVDAVLPPAHGQVPLAPPALLAQLQQQADPDGLLPVWTDWWDEADVAPLFPDTATREAVQREQQRLPVRYFAEALPVPAGWDDRPFGYLAFGDIYADERREAERRGWPVRTLAGAHLHMLVDPAQVAAEVRAVLAALGVCPPADAAASGRGAASQ